MNANRLLSLVILAGVFSCAAPDKKSPYADLPDERLHAIADSLADKFIITDGHVDLPFRLRTIHFRLDREYLGIPISSTEGDFDFERAKKGGLDAPFMSIYIPSVQQDFPHKGKPLADSLINMIKGIADSIPDKFALAGTPQEVEANTREGKIWRMAHRSAMTSTM
jgi:membrane dipeptidase